MGTDGHDTADDAARDAWEKWKAYMAGKDDEASRAYTALFKEHDEAGFEAFRGGYLSGMTSAVRLMRRSDKKQ